MGFHCVTGIPSTRTSPSVGATRRLIILRQVVLPDPLRPSNISVSPRPMERFTPDTRALLSEIRKVTSANSMAMLESLMARVAPAYQKLSFDRPKCAHKHECRSQSSDDQLRQNITGSRLSGVQQQNVSSVRNHHRRRPSGHG